MLIVLLPSLATAKASVSTFNGLNIYVNGYVALAQFDVPIYLIHGMTSIEFDNSPLTATVMVIEPFNSKVAYMVAVLCYESAIGGLGKYEATVTCDSTGKILYSSAYVPLDIVSWLHGLYGQLFVAWVLNAPTSVTGQVATITWNDCAKVNVYGGFWTYAQAYGSLFVDNTWGEGYSWNAFVAAGNININLGRLFG